MARPKTDSADYALMTVRLPHELIEYLRQEAATAGRPMTTHVYWMLDYLRRHPVDLKPPPRSRPQTTGVS